MSTTSRVPTKDKGVYMRTSTVRRHQGKPDVCFEITYKENGRKIWEKIGWRSEGITQAVAAQKRRERMERIRLGKPVDRVKHSLTFGEAYKEWEETHLPTLKECKKLKSLANTHVIPAFGNRLMSTITSHDISKFQTAMLKKGYSKQTVVHAFSLIRRVYKKSILWKLYSGECPTDGIKSFRLDNERLFYLTKEQAYDFMCILHDISPFWHDIAMVSLHTGMRLGDILSLRFRQINFTSKIIDVIESKPGYYTAYMTEELTDMLIQRMVGRKSDELVFPSSTGTVIQNAGEPFNQAVEETGFNDGVTDRLWIFSFHSLRHTYGSLLAQEGVPDKVIAVLLGHSSLKMTKRYAKLSPKNKIGATAIVSSLFHA